MTPASHSSSVEVTVGLDIGTTSVKAVAADADGRILARARVPHRVLTPSPGCLEHDPNAAWARGPKKALAAVAAEHAPAAIGVAAMVPSIAAVNRRGRALTPGLLYGDERGRTATGGSPATSGEALEFVRWAAARQPDAVGYWPAQAMASHALCGVAAMDVAVALSFAPPYGASGWDDDALKGVGADVSQLPSVHDVGARVGEANGVPVCAGTVDVFAEQAVAGGGEVGDVLVMCGTTLLPWVVVPEWRDVAGLWTVPHSSAAGMAMVGGASNAGGLFLNWVLGTVGAKGEEPSDPARVPVWLPYPRGERTPYHDPDRRASLHDLDLTHDAAAIRRAAYEASAFVVRHHVDLAGVAPRRIIATGGGTHVEGWMQALADCVGVPVESAAVAEGAALGAAFLARIALGLEQEPAGARRWARTGRTFEPRRDWADAASARYGRFRELTA
jgi:xylulokinase